MVKEFTIDAAVQTTVNELGVLQFVLADDTMPPQSVSRVSITLAGVAKAQDETVPKSVVADGTPLVDLPWLPPSLASQLAQYEIKTAAEFLGLVADARFAAQITSLLKVRREEIGRWANQMRLLELPGMTIGCAGILGELGIFAVADLAQLSDEAMAALQRKAAKKLTPEMLAKWSIRHRALLSLGAPPLTSASAVP